MRTLLFLVMLFIINSVSADDLSDLHCFSLNVYDEKQGSVNIYNEPNGYIIESIENGSVVYQVEGSARIEGWNYVVLEDGLEVYVMDNVLYKKIYKVYDANDTYANLRTKPSGKIIRAVSNGITVKFLGVKGNWTKVQLFSGEIGYIYSQLLTEPDCF